MSRTLPKSYVRWLQKEVDLSRRARVAVEHMLKHGSITTTELKQQYGYDHPPRAIRDVREAGIPVKTQMITTAEGVRMASYTLGDPAEVEKEKSGGRRGGSKQFKDELAKLQGARCAICRDRYEKRYLQVDHRVPYEVAGDSTGKRRPEDYMLLCGSCNRAKSWSCEHCENWRSSKSADKCRQCYWGSPEKYVHVALRAVRRLTVVWSGREVSVYERIEAQAEAQELAMPDYVKAVLARHLASSH